MCEEGKIRLSRVSEVIRERSGLVGILCVIGFDEFLRVGEVICSKPFVFIRSSVISEPSDIVSERYFPMSAVEFGVEDG